MRHPARSRICRAYCSQSVASRRTAPVTKGSGRDRGELGGDQAALVVLALVPRIGEEHPQLVDGCRWQKVLEDLGRVRLHEPQVLDRGLLGVQHGAGKSRGEHLDREEVHLGVCGCRVDDRVALTGPDLDDERGFSPPHLARIDHRTGPHARRRFVTGCIQNVSGGEVCPGTLLTVGHPSVATDEGHGAIAERGGLGHPSRLASGADSGGRPAAADQSVRRSSETKSMSSSTRPSSAGSRSR